jgi:epoxyqueuosine reductase
MKGGESSIILFPPGFSLNRAGLPCLNAVMEQRGIDIGIDRILHACRIRDWTLVRGPLCGIGSRTILACALAYPLAPEPPDPTALEGTEPYAVVASFARVHHYRVLAKRLMQARDMLIPALSPLFSETPMKKADFPIHVNSRLNEKEIAGRAGLGRIGLHSLLITEKSGCACVIGAMGIPAPISGAGPPLDAPMPYPGCESCQACRRACPSAAILESGGIDKRRCVQQYLSGADQEPETVRKAWGRRLYGCDECLAACPMALGSDGERSLSPEDALGAVDARIDIASILDSSDDSLRERFKGSALGLSWLGPGTLRKNARLALESWGRA